MLQLIRTDYVFRFHLYVDTHAAKFDAFRVELLEQSIFLAGDTMEALWEQVHASINHMRNVYEQRPLYPWLVFSPFARIIALDAARVGAEYQLTNGMIVGQLHPTHEERVRGLGKAVDALEYLQSKPAKPQVLN